MPPHTLAMLLIKPPLWATLVAAAGFAALAWSAQWLTLSGALSTFVVGFVIFGFGGGIFMVPLLTFFLSSSVLSRITKRRRGVAAGRDIAPGRNASQVWANGGVAVCLVIAFAALSHRWPVYQTRYLLMLYLAALATVNADTWSTEIGGLSRRAPRFLANWRSVPPGVSGAITPLGIVAAAAGALVVPLSVFALWRMDTAELLAVAWAGFLGSFTDSLLGAGIQAQYRDSVTGDLRDLPEARAGTALARGFRWINNDLVNFLASASGVLWGWLLLRYGVYPYR